MKYVYIQDDFVSSDKAALPLHDRGARFGDGAFETVRVENGGMYNLAFHLKRLNSGLEALKINAVEWENAAKELITKNNLKSGFIRISVSRGGGSKGYMPISNDGFVVIETVEGFEVQKETAKLHISSYRAQAAVAAKTLNAQNYILAMIEAAENGCDNALLLDAEENICETASGNIFWVSNGLLHTPSLDLPLIPGSIREKVLTLYDGEIFEGKYKLDELAKAEEIFMTNVNCLVLPFTQSAEIARKIKKLVENDIKSQLG